MQKGNRLTSRQEARRGAVSHVCVSHSCHSFWSAAMWPEAEINSTGVWENTDNGAAWKTFYKRLFNEASFLSSTFCPLLQNYLWCHGSFWLNNQNLRKQMLPEIIINFSCQSKKMCMLMFTQNPNISLQESRTFASQINTSTSHNGCAEGMFAFVSYKNINLPTSERLQDVAQDVGWLPPSSYCCVSSDEALASVKLCQTDKYFASEHFAFPQQLLF